MERRLDITKIVYSLFLFTSTTTSIIPIILAYDLICLDSYEAFITLLDKFYINLSFFAKVIISNLDYMNFTIFKVLSSLLTNISFMNLLMVIQVAYLWAASKESVMKKRNRSWQWIVICYAFGYCLIALIIILNFQLTSLNAIMILFHYAGIIMMITHLCIIAISVRFLIPEIKAVYYLLKRILKNTP